jgi:hypothetical protein
LGWTKIDYIEALTGMRIIFNPLEDDDAVWEAFREAIAGLPDTSGFFPKVTFGFCDGSNIIESEDAGSPWEKDYFYGIPQEYIGQLNKCTAHMSYNRILVTISSSCSPSFADSGICIKPPQDGVGEAYIAGSPRAYVYKDPVDLAALIIGGDRKDAVGYYVGEETWKFKNNFFLDSISLAAKFMERRNDFVTQHIPEKQEECVPAYESLKTSLINIQALARGDPYDVGEMSALKSELETARSLWLDLLDMGCESYVSG